MPTDSFEIEGLAAERKLEGKLAINGAKNAVIKVLAAAILFKDEVRLDNVPAIEDVFRMEELLGHLGAEVTEEGPNKFLINTSQINEWRVDEGISKRLRASVVATGPLLARLGKVHFPHPGGCVIGKRPIDIFLEGFQAMGATLKEDEKGYDLKAPDGLTGAEIFLKVPSVTATETFLMTAVLAKGKTVIKNAALEPEICSLGNFLKSCGANIEGLGTPTITVAGDGLLSGVNKTYTTMPDRIEAGSFIILAALLAKDLEIFNCDPTHLDSLIHLLKQSGVKMEVGKDYIRIKDDQGDFKAVDIKTHEYPGFPTDLQAPMSIFLTQALGQSFVFETIFEGRLNYLETLARFGANTRVLDAHRAIIEGKTKLHGKEVESPDLRAGLAYVLAGLVAEGKSIVHNVYYIDRGYERIDERLAKVGALIRRTA